MTLLGALPLDPCKECCPLTSLGALPLDSHQIYWNFQFTVQPTIIVQLEEQLPTEQMRATTLKEKLVERDKVLEESDNQLAEEDQLVVEKETQVVDVQ